MKTAETQQKDDSSKKCAGEVLLRDKDLYPEEIQDSGLCHHETEVRMLTWTDIKRQIFAINLGYLPYTNGGIALAFSNLMLEELDINSSSWFASIIGLSTPVGALISGPLMDKLGRKGVNMVIAILCIPSWFLTGFVDLQYPVLLYGTRICIGLAAGMATANIIYVSEISHKQYRPAFLTFANIYFSFGILLISSLQMFLTWRHTAIFVGIFFIITFILNAVLIPESPTWLAHFRGDLAAAKRSLKWLNPNAEVFAEEWRALRLSIRSNRGPGKKKSLDMLSPTIYKPFLIMFALFSLQQLSFIYAVIIYAVKVIPFVSPEFGQVVKSEAFALLGIVRFVGNILCSVLSLKVGRRPLLLISSFGMVVACLLEAISPLILNGSVEPNLYYIYNWSLQIILYGFIFFSTIGVMSLPWTLMSEFLPQEARSVGSAIIICYGYFLMFVAAKIFPFILQVFSAVKLFTFMSIISAITFFFVFFFVPETFGKSFSDIEKHFSRQS